MHESRDGTIGDSPSEEYTLPLPKSGGYRLHLGSSRNTRSMDRCAANNVRKLASHVGRILLTFRDLTAFLLDNYTLLYSQTEHTYQNHKELGSELLPSSFSL